MTPPTPPIRMSYVDTAAGQIHVRSAGAGPAFVLLHWAPASGRMYEPVMTALADMGYRSVALDLPGYGRSCKPGRILSAEELALTLAQAVAALGIDQAVLVGGHLSTHPAVEMALADPARFTALVLDGVLAPSDDELHHLMQGFADLSPRLRGDERYRSFAFDMTINTLREWNPDFVLDEQSLTDVYALANDYLEMGLGEMRRFVEPDGPPPSPYPLLERLRQVRQPTLILSAEREPLRPAYFRALEAKPDATGYTFTGIHPLMDVSRGHQYARCLDGFVKD
jgi:pimeloyl-ACP methyl ester carboxylesterase